MNAPLRLSRSMLSGAHQSLRARLLLGTVLWISIALIITGTVLTILFKTHATKQFDQELRTYLIQLVANLDVSTDGKAFLKTQPAEPRFNQPLSGLYWQISDNHHHDVLRSRSLWDSTLDVSPELDQAGKQLVRTAVGPNAESIRLLEQVVKLSEAPGKVWRISVAAETKNLDQAIQDWVRLLVIFLGILLLTLILAAIAQVMLALTPLRNLQQALIALSAGQTKRLEGEFPAEVQPLVQEFNQVLDHQDSMIIKAQNRAGDFAHAMKTPLTVLANAATAELQKKKHPSELALLMNEQIELLKNQIDQQLLRARTDAVSLRSYVQTPIAPVIEQIIRVIKKMHADRHIDFVVMQEDLTICVPIDKNTLQEIIGNLIDNASKWAQTTIRIKIYIENQQLCIAIEDDGKGVAADQLYKIMQRGIRADERVPGSGLGLSIASELCSVYDGELILFTSELGGLGAKISLPLTLNPNH
ncbi:sensor histidine kinase [Zwartia sp.]|uniref:sensor histidine kinase n=1 Tax=Zwartia sp. TaxID=2978004 RepID=UPI003BB19522